MSRSAPYSGCHSIMALGHLPGRCAEAWAGPARCPQLALNKSLAEAQRRRDSTSVRKAIDDSGDAVLDPIGTEVQEQAEALVRQSNVGEDLLLVDG